jgi:hypothetical protein
LRRRAAIVGILLSVGFVAACGGDPSGPRRSVDVLSASGRLQRLLLQTASRIGAPGAKSTPDTTVISGPDPCLDDAGRETGRFRGSYGVRVLLPSRKDLPGLFEQVRTYWTTEGFTVGRVSRLESSEPTMTARSGGWLIGVDVDRARSIAHLSGSTACLPMH